MERQMVMYPAPLSSKPALPAALLRIREQVSKAITLEMKEKYQKLEGKMKLKFKKDQ